MSQLIATVSQQIDYNYWAHRRVWAYVSKLTDDQYAQPLDYSQGSIHQQVVHTMWAEDIWFARISDLPQPSYSAADFKDRAAVRAKWDAIEMQVRKMVRQFDDDQLIAPVSYQNSKGETFEQTVLQIILHLVNHGTDHRAQTLAMMHVLGAETVPQDLIYFYRLL
ncbi:MAG: DinB family protein [Chloroflexota bacterium]